MVGRELGKEHASQLGKEHASQIYSKEQGFALSVTLSKDPHPFKEKTRGNETRMTGIGLDRVSPLGLLCVSFIGCL